MSIGIVGLGYVGLPLAVAFAEAGEQVIGVDVDPGKVAGLREGRSHIEDIPSERLAAALDRMEFTTRAVDLHGAEAILVCVPTPLNRNREPDLGPLLGAARTLAGVIARGQLVVLESTTFPGTTREHLVPLLEESGLVAGADFSLAFSPERVDPGRTDYTLATRRRSSAGSRRRARKRALEVYGRVCDELVPVSTPEVAELAKLLENIFRSVNIALVNELAILADRMGIDIWEVVDAAATKPFGFMRFEPGPGMGGHCLPVDPFYLTWKAREYDMATEFIELAGKVNKQMPYFCLEKIERALNDAGKPVKGSAHLIVGVSYKAGVGDLRESPALKIIELLRERGGDVAYHDPHVPELPAHGLRSVEPSECDLAVIVTAHPEVDHGAVVAQAPAVLDLRGVTRRLRDAKVTQLLSQLGEEQRRAAETADWQRRTARTARWSGSNPGNRAIREELVAAALAVLPPADRVGDVLDVGCGSGWWLRRLADAGVPADRLHGIDVQPERVHAATAATPGAQVLEAAAQSLPYSDGTFDVITMLTVLSSLHDAGSVRAALLEARRVCREDGLIVVWEPRYPTPNTRTRWICPTALSQVLGPAEQTRTLTLLPPLARSLGARTTTAYARLARLRLLRTHRLTTFRR